MVKLAINIVGEPNIILITEHKLYPINTRLIDKDSKAYRYIVDQQGYRWIGEELWFERAIKG